MNWYYRRLAKRHLDWLGVPEHCKVVGGMVADRIEFDYHVETFNALMAMADYIAAGQRQGYFND